MKLLVIGASRGVGRAVVELASASGHRVTAFARQPSEYCAGATPVERVQGDARSLSDIDLYVAEQDAVICTLGADTRGATDLYSLAAKNIAAAMDRQRVYRLLFLSNFGVLGERSAHPMTALLLAAARAALKGTLADHREALRILATSKVGWTAVRPMGLTNAARTGRYRVSEESLPPGGVRISRGDVADFMLRQLRSDEFVRKAPGIAY